VAEQQRQQQKLWLILFQIRAVRSRINWLAAQYFLFSTLALVIGAAVLVTAAALLMKPLWFLLSAAAIASIAFAGVIRVTATTLRSRANQLKAAALADERAGLKGRLMTVLLTAGKLPRSDLWPYLIEDTYGRRVEFEPAKIEPRWLSRAIFALAAVCVAGLLLIRLARLETRVQMLAMNRLPAAVTADTGHLEIRPADPALEPNAEIYADEAVMQKLADKLAAERNHDNDTHELSRWMDKARDLAGELQNEITGQRPRPPVQLRLTDEHPKDGSSAGGGAAHHGTNQSGQANNSGAGKPGGEGIQSQQSAQPRDLAQSGPGLAGQAGSDSAQNPSQPGWPLPGETGGGGGASHGAGSDPEHLFGPPASQALGSNSFKITIDAQPSDESSSREAPAYIPPKVKVPLNDKQYGDEPLARASVPAADEMTIKRVFER